MILKSWDQLPPELQLDEVRPYYDMLAQKKSSLALKRLFDITVSSVMLVLLSPVYLGLAIAIKSDSPGPVFFRQVRVTQYGRQFRIFKFRTMVNNAEKMGAQVTANNDSRITKVGSAIRKCRLDETAQLLNVFLGDMSFVGTRPEVPKYASHYTDEMMATLLLPAGVTSQASILYKDEDELLGQTDDPDTVYVNEILPAKMKYNLQEIKDFSFGKDIKTMFQTVGAVLKH